MPNENWVEGKWTEFKGEVQKMWGNLTDDDLEQTKGNIKSIGGLIQQKYGNAEDRVHERLDEIGKRFSSAATNATEDAKQDLSSAVRRDDAAH